MPSRLSPLRRRVLIADDANTYGAFTPPLLRATMIAMLLLACCLRAALSRVLPRQPYDAAMSASGMKCLYMKVPRVALRATRLRAAYARRRRYFTRGAQRVARCKEREKRYMLHASALRLRRERLAYTPCHVVSRVTLYFMLYTCRADTLVFAVSSFVDATLPAARCLRSRHWYLPAAAYATTATPSSTCCHAA